MTENQLFFEKLHAFKQKFFLSKHDKAVVITNINRVVSRSHYSLKVTRKRLVLTDDTPNHFEEYVFEFNRSVPMPDSELDSFKTKLNEIISDLKKKKAQAYRIQ